MFWDKKEKLMSLTSKFIYVYPFIQFILMLTNISFNVCFLFH